MEDETKTIQTIEKTSKTLKGWLLAFWVICLLGIYLMVSNTLWLGIFQDMVGYVFVVGIVGIIYVKVLIWWRHG